MSRPILVSSSYIFFFVSVRGRIIPWICAAWFVWRGNGNSCRGIFAGSK